MRYALIGCGRIGARHILAAKAAGLDIAAVCDLKEERAAAFAKDTGALPLRDYKDALALCPDIVAVATDSGSHYRIARAALLSGADVILEKPMAMCLSDADSLISIAEQKRLMLTVCHQNRFNRPVQALLSALAENRLGNIVHGAAQVRWWRDDAYYKSAPWRGRYATDGGCLLNQSIHCIDLLRECMGRPEEVCCMARNAMHPEIEAEDTAVAVVRFASSAVGLIEASTCTVPENLSETLSVFGDRGSVVIGGVCLDEISSWRAEGMEAPAAGETPPDIYGFGHAALYQDFVGAIEQPRPPVVTARHGREALALTLACMESAATGRTVKVR